MKTLAERHHHHTLSVGLMLCSILKVIINPHSGKKTALKTWKEVSRLFEQANINTKVCLNELLKNPLLRLFVSELLFMCAVNQVLETTRVRHAFEVLNGANDDELSKLDGVVIVVRNQNPMCRWIRHLNKVVKTLVINKNQERINKNLL